MKITVITACRNAAKTLVTTLESIRRQKIDGFELEYIVVDGASTDGTPDLLARTSEALQTSNLQPPSSFSFRWLSEPDRNMYDGVNKGIKMATGDIIGILNSDDVFAADDVLAKIAAYWRANPGLDATYGDVRFVHRGEYGSVEELQRAKTKRYLTGRFFRKWMFRFATFPAHPSTFVRRECYEKFGLHSLEYKICADFEMMLRLFVKHDINAKYVPLCTTVMRPDGLSTNGVKSKFDVNAQDLAALRAHGIWSCRALVYLKYLFKIWGYILKK